MERRGVLCGALRYNGVGAFRSPFFFIVVSNTISIDYPVLLFDNRLVDLLAVLNSFDFIRIQNGYPVTGYICFYFIQSRLFKICFFFLEHYLI